MRIVYLLTSLFLILTFGCQEEKSKKAAQTTPTLEVPSDSFLISQVETNLRGLNMEDFAIAMEPLDLSSPYMSEAENSMRGAFMVYEMEFRLHDVKIQFKSDSVCYALVQHDSRNHNERVYDSKRSTQRYTWKPVRGQWKIHKMEVVGSTPVEY